MQTIFEPFQQVGDREQRGQGTGLGLAISRNLIQLMGGDLQLKSTPGQGSIFWFEIALPAVADEDRRAIEQPRQIVGLKGEAPTVLVVDDNWENRAVIVGLLTPLGFEILEAGNGREGLVIATERQPEAIITDLVMPEMDGFALIRQIRQDEALQGTVIIAASASVYEEDRRKSLDTGSDVFIPKPVEAGRLLAQLQRLLHLEWRYQESVEPGDQPAEFILPPADTLQELLDLSDGGDAEELQQRLTALMEVDGKYGPFVKQFYQLAGELKLDAISELLEEYCETAYIGAQYLYETPEVWPNLAKNKTGTLTPDSLAILPADLLARFEKVVLLSDMQIIDEMLQEIRAQQPGLADALQQLADNFEYAHILELIQQSK